MKGTTLIKITIYDNVLSSYCRLQRILVVLPSHWEAWRWWITTDLTLLVHDWVCHGFHACLLLGILYI